MPTKLHFRVREAVIIVALCAFALGCGSNKNGKNSPNLGAGEGDQRKRSIALSSDYSALRSRIVSHNNETTPSAWLMNSEHLFVEDDVLHQDVIMFSRIAGGLDFLFDRVLDSATSDEELLVLSEILVYFGGHPEPGDDKIVSTRSAEIIKVLSGGRAAKADEQYRAPISKKIREAAEKAISNRVPSSRPQQT